MGGMVWKPDMWWMESKKLTVKVGMHTRYIADQLLPPITQRKERYMRVLVIVIALTILYVSAGKIVNEPLGDICPPTEFRKLGKRLNWNENNGKTKDFILTVRYKEGGIVFCPSFIVHPMEREEDFPLNMEIVEIGERGL